ncbi:MAG: hypothetical protein ABL964_01420 [Steroidobacteraceae bacterium]
MPGIDSLSTLIKRLSLGDRLIRRNPLRYPAARAWIAQHAQATLQQRRELTLHQLRRSLRVAATTAYGRSAGGSSDIADWPLLEKPVLRNSPRAFRTASSWLAGEASTSGTTGLQIPLLRSLGSMTVEQAYIDGVIEQLGSKPRTARVAILRGENVKSAEDRTPPYWIHGGNGQRLHMSCSHLGPDTIHAYAMALKEFKPDVLWVYPSNLEWLCHLLQKSDLTLRIPHVLSSSEVLGPVTWRLAEQVLGANVADYYGQAERVTFGYALRHGDFRFTPGYAHLELLPLDTAGAVTRHEIVGTTLWNNAMPLVRYRTGDFVELPSHWGPAEIEEVIYGLRPISGILGRTIEYLVSPEGAILNGAGNLTKGVNNVVRLQLFQPDLATVQVRVLVQPPFSPQDLAKLQRNARDNIPPSMAVSVEVVEELERTAIGKTPLVIHGDAMRQYLAGKQLTDGRETR